MRLLHIQGDPWGDEPLDISLCVKLGPEIPRYMILSHRWRTEEVLFSDITDADPSVARRKEGWAKVETSCRIALQMGICYAWNDTCCIDKTSSAELSEAINSMYTYYSRSAICFAYLDDVESYATPKNIEASIWFTRAWTLQELIAPKEIYIYSGNWKVLGTKWSLCNSLSEASHVPEEVLRNPHRLGEFSVAERMYWAAWREATREEDEAYSLMGIFEVNMPPLYGEGRARAFRRLQMEIMQHSHDHTIFAWNRRTTNGDMLATSPRDFLSQHTYCRMKLETYVDTFGLEEAKLDYTMTNIGLHIELPIISVPHSDNMFLGLIACFSKQDASCVAILLEKNIKGRYTRWSRRAWRDCSIFHLSGLRSSRCAPKELWISRQLFSNDFAYNDTAPISLSTTGRLTINLKNATKPWEVHSTIPLHEDSHQDFAMWTNLLDRYESKVDIITLRNNATVHNIGLELAFGTLNDRMWIFCRVNVDPHYLGHKNLLEELNRDFAFPSGRMWRYYTHDFIMFDPVHKDVLSANGTVDIQQYQREIHAETTRWKIQCTFSGNTESPLFHVHVYEDVAASESEDGLRMVSWTTQLHIV